MPRVRVKDGIFSLIFTVNSSIYSAKRKKTKNHSYTNVNEYITFPNKNQETHSEYPLLDLNQRVKHQNYVNELLGTQHMTEKKKK